MEIQIPKPMTLNKSMIVLSPQTIALNNPDVNKQKKQKNENICQKQILIYLANEVIWPHRTRIMKTNFNKAEILSAFKG